MCILHLYDLYFIAGILYLSIPFTYLIDPPSPLTSGSDQFVLCI